MKVFHSIACTILGLIGASIFSASNGVSDELPQSRPSIESIPAAALSPQYASENWGRDFSALFDAGTSFIAEMIAFYPDKDLYFLARDGEYLYDLARLYLQDQPERLKHIRILNGSRNAYRKPEQMRAYLIQEGVTPARLNEGSVVMIDSGVIGSIHKKMSELFPEVSAEKIKSHFLLSGNFSIPQSRVFLTQFRPGRGYVPGNGQSSSAYEGAVMREFENYPHYTGPYDQVQFIDGKWVGIPSSVDLIENRGKGSLERIQSDRSMKAEALMAAIRFEIEKPGARDKFNSTVRAMSEVLLECRNPKSFDSEQIKASLSGLTPLQRNAFVSDILDAAQKTNVYLKNSDWISFLKKLPESVFISADVLLYVAGKIPEPMSVSDYPKLNLPKNIREDIESIGPKDKQAALALAKVNDPETASMLILRMGERDWYGDTAVVSAVIASKNFLDHSVQHLIGNYILSYPEIPESLMDEFLTRLPELPYFFLKRMVYAPHWYQSEAARKALIRWAGEDRTSHIVVSILRGGYVPFWSDVPEALVALKMIIHRSKRFDHDIVNYVLSNNASWEKTLKRAGIARGFSGLETYREGLQAVHCREILHPTF